MLAQTHGHHTGRDVYVIGCGHDDGIDVLPFLIQHPALVAESLYLGEHLKGIGRTLGVDPQNATILSLMTFWTLSKPLPPTPIQAILSFSLGRACPGSPSTCLGINSKATADAVTLRKSRRLYSVDESVVSFLFIMVALVQFWRLYQSVAS